MASDMDLASEQEVSMEPLPDKDQKTEDKTGPHKSDCGADT